MTRSTGFLIIVSTVLCGLYVGGCGEIIDKDNIVIAKLDEKEITRGILKDYIRDFGDEERPIVQYKSDVLRVLDDYIDIQITDVLARRLNREGTIATDRERLMQQYLVNNPDEAIVFQIVDPAAAGFTPLQVEAMKTAVEFAVDDLEYAELREKALIHLASEIIRTNPNSISEDDYRQSYEKQKAKLETFEIVSFVGIRFPVTTMPTSRQEAAKVRERIRQGESFETLFNTFVDSDPNYGVRSGLRNDPGTGKFLEFWDQVSGAEIGELVGPVYMSEYQQRTEDGQSVPIPPTWAVVKVLERQPPRQMTLDEAKRSLAISILRQRAINQLRAEHGVEVYEDKLWDPSGYGDQFEGQFIEVD